MRATIFALIACLSATSAGASAQTLSFHGDGVTTQAFMADLAELYANRGRGQMELTLTSSSDALRAVSAGEVDLGGSMRPADNLDRQERRVTMHPVAWDGLVAVVNRANPILNISLAQLQDVISGELTSWEGLGGEDRPINLVRLADDRQGLNHVVAELMLGDARASLPATTRVATLGALDEAIAADPLALALVPYSSARRMQGKILTTEGLAATQATLSSGEYPLFVPLYLGLREDGANRRQVRRLLTWMGSAEAKRILRRRGIVPYAEALGLVSRQLERARTLAALRDD